MKNKISLLITFIFFNFFLFQISYASEQFNFNVTEIEILENGNIIKGNKKEL